MSSLVHEIAVARIDQDPSLLPALAEKLLGRRPRGKPRPVDSTVRFVDPAEVRPDLILGSGKRGPWDAIEIQRRIDRRKEDSWVILVAVLRRQRGRMGDLWVITASRRTAAWARKACDAAGPNGTRLRVKPIVLLIGRKEVEALLDEGQPSLAFFAAWAMQNRHGPEAEQVVLRAVEVTDRLPDKALRDRQQGDIMDVQNRRMVKRLQETVMDKVRTTESRWVREWRHKMFAEQTAEMAGLEARGEARGKAEGKAEGKRDALLLVLEGRGLSITRAQRAQILGCVDLSTLDRWIAASVTAASVRELLAAPATRKNGARKGSTKQRAARAA